MKLTDTKPLQIYFLFIIHFLVTVNTQFLFADSNQCPLSKTKESRVTEDEVFILNAENFRYQEFSISEIEENSKKLNTTIRNYFTQQNVQWHSASNESSDIVISVEGLHPLNQFALNIRRKYRAQFIVDTQTYFEFRTVSAVDHDLTTRKSTLIPSLRQILFFDTIEEDSVFKHEEQHLITNLRFKQGVSTYRVGSITRFTSDKSKDLLQKNQDTGSSYQDYFTFDELNAFVAEALGILKKVRKHNEITPEDIHRMENINTQLKSIGSRIELIADFMTDKNSQFQIQKKRLNKKSISLHSALLTSDGDELLVNLPVPISKYHNKTTSDLTQLMRTYIFQVHQNYHMVKKSIPLLLNLNLENLNSTIETFEQLALDIDD